MTSSQLERGQEEVKDRCQQILVDSGGEVEQLVAMGCSGETSMCQKQRKERSSSRKGPRKVREASFKPQGSLSSSTLSVISPTPFPQPPTCISTHCQEAFPEFWKNLP